MLLNPIVLLFCTTTIVINYIYSTMFIYLLLILLLVLYFFDNTNLLDEFYLESFEKTEENKLEIFFLELIYLLCYIKSLQLINSKIELYLVLKHDFIQYNELLTIVSIFMNKYYLFILKTTFFFFYILPLTPNTMHKSNYLYNPMSSSLLSDDYLNVAENCDINDLDIFNDSESIKSWSIQSRYRRSNFSFDLDWKS